MALRSMNLIIRFYILVLILLLPNYLLAEQTDVVTEEMINESSDGKSSVATVVDPDAPLPETFMEDELDEEPEITQVVTLDTPVSSDPADNELELHHTELMNKRTESPQNPRGVESLGKIVVRDTFGKERFLNAPVSNKRVIDMHLAGPIANVDYSKNDSSSESILTRSMEQLHKFLEKNFWVKKDSTLEKSQQRLINVNLKP